MELSELYNKIENPLDKPEIIEKLINIYASNQNFYYQLVHNAEKEYFRQYQVSARDKLHAMLFNKWKNSIIAMTRDDFLKLNGVVYGQGFIKMREYLKTVSDVTTMKEAMDILYAPKQDKELEKALERYSWLARSGDHNDFRSWTHVCSADVTAHKDPIDSIDHRLYLDLESVDIDNMATFFIEKCDKYNVPYYFKYAELGNRDDTMVVYSSTENLTKYLDILQEIKREHPEIISRAKQPPILTGNMDGWIGYGSEPTSKSSRNKDSRNSFNNLRSEVISGAIDKATKEWIRDHITMKLRYNGQLMSFSNFITERCIDEKVKYLEEEYASHDRKLREEAKKRGMPTTSIVDDNKLNYTLEYIRSKGFREEIYRVFSEYINKHLETILTSGFKGIKEMADIRNNGKLVTGLTAMNLEQRVREFATTIMRSDPNFVQTVKKEILESAKKQGIDINNFCFDVDAKKKIDDLVTNKTFKALDVRSFTKIINPALLNGKMKLPNGIEIPTEQYLEEVVFAHLPSNGVVTLANGYQMPVKQFIEENVMFECQRDYNGDFIKYLAEKTRNNSGTVTCDFNGAKYEIMPTDITRFLNPVLLGQSIKLPNGKEISAREYIKDYYAPYIPRNGMVTLTNGNVIPVQEFIEKTLLSEENTKYNGDINQILYYTTRNNNGVINGDLEEIKEEIQKMKNEVVREPIKQQQKVEKPETPKKDPLKPMDTKKQENDQERELLLQLQREEIMRIMNEAPLKEKEEEKREKQRKLIDDLMQDAKREVSPEERKKALEELRQRMLQQKREGYVLSDNFAQGLEGNIHEHSRGR